MLTQAKLKEVLLYNDKTGIFTWKSTRNGFVKAGDFAGSINEGYKKIKVDHKTYGAHRLAWLYVYGYLPENQIDHINGKGLDNRITNLRETTQRCNSQNSCIPKNNTSGFKGVTFDSKLNTWRVRIMFSGKSTDHGRYKTPLEAALVRLTIENQCPEWSCDKRSCLARAIKKAWPEFNDRCLA